MLGRFEVVNARCLLGPARVPDGNSSARAEASLRGWRLDLVASHEIRPNVITLDLQFVEIGDRQGGSLSFV